ncbi:helix-turn-helix transcriptional regulator [Paenibacillus sp. 1P07SE]|uniref:helix-turn-helix transcriptional regulator n=1 Tax=Paenibacillus sp. 1P07SE TaxID=3132209 RepID=UPI0039A7292F
MEADIYLAADRLPLVQDIGWNLSETVYTHPDRVLGFNVFLFVASGRMQVIEEDREYLVGPGEHMFLKQGLHHYGRPRASEAGTGWYWIHFRTPGLASASDDGQEPLPDLSFYHPEHYRYRLALPKYGSTPWHAALGQRLEQLLRQSRERGVPHRMTWLSVQVYLFLELQRAAGEAGDPQRPQGKAAALPGRVMSYLKQHAREELDADALSRQLQLNYSYISATFSRLTGQTVVQAHTKLRIEQAVALMRDTSLNISEIAKQVGYTNPFYFSRVFKKTMGESPSSYLSHFYRTPPGSG